MQATQEQLELRRKEEEEEDKQLTEKRKDDPEGTYYSSGLESDNDIDLLIEQDYLRSQRIRDLKYKKRKTVYIKPH